MAVAPIQTVVHDSELGNWELITRAPAGPLRPYVLRYEGYLEYSAVPVRRRELPFPGAVLIISFTNPYRISTPEARPGAAVLTSFLAGMHDTYVLSESIGAGYGMQVNFTPIGAHLFLGRPMNEFTNVSVDLTDIFGPDARRLAEQLRDVGSWESRFEVLDSLFMRRFAASPEPSAAVVHVWERLRTSGGNAEVASLAAEVGWSRKHLAARFREEVGLPPKAVARVLRFDRAVSMLKDPARTCLADVSAACGYFDQPHFIHEFRALGGSTPGDFRRGNLADGTGLLDNVLNPA